MRVRFVGFVLSAAKYWLVVFIFSVSLSQVASAQHIMPAPPPPKSGIFTPPWAEVDRKSPQLRAIQRTQRKKRPAPMVPVPSSRYFPSIAANCVLRASV